ncbi:uncharacterized protein LOC123550657 [Mercenaria mercenaria]|uniref:uncharacterized protein LOC123550657 n=1 Tax=Mercenaria mercenaria TaxID=6596 RepID=UPI00234EBC9E|nr:uncharacterized protein LOC123550657 [Mercenaria mercenaria]
MYVPAYMHGEDKWYPVDTERSAYVFSAYFMKEKRKIFIIGVKQKRGVPLVCQFWIKQENSGNFTMEETGAEINVPLEQSNHRYRSIIFECPFDSPHLPEFISLGTRRCESPLNLLRVHNATVPQRYERRFTVCLKPLHSHFGQAMELVEWFELNRILGAEKFIVYNFSTSVKVQQVLDYYSKRGLAEVVKWQLPLLIRKRIQKVADFVKFGQHASLNDCLFRNKHFSEFFIDTDVDEYLIPMSKHAMTWSDIIKTLKPDAHSYLFRNVFFRKEWKNKSLDFHQRRQAELLNLVTLQHFEHEKKTWPYKMRSKFIARTAKIDFAMVHFNPVVGEVNVPVGTGLLFHYRNWGNYSDKSERVTDDIVLKKFGDVLITNVQNILKDLGQVDEYFIH